MFELTRMGVPTLHLVALKGGRSYCTLGPTLFCDASLVASGKKTCSQQQDDQTRSRRAGLHYIARFALRAVGLPGVTSTIFATSPSRPI
jgi:hypothetical protein